MAFVAFTANAQVIMTSVDFEDGTFGDFSVIQNNTSDTFYIGEVTANTDNTSTKYAKIEYDDNLQQQDEYLVSPSLDFTNVTSAEASFSYMMSYHWGVAPNNNYDMNFVVSTDGGTTWTEIWDETSDPGFISTDQQYKFRPIVVDLSAYAGEADVKVAMQYLGLDGAQAGVDDFVVTDKTAMGLNELQLFDFSYKPNPVNNELNIQANSNIETVSIMSLLGQRIIFLTPNTLQTSIDTSNLDAGVYLVEARIGNTSGTFKIVKK